MTRTTGFHFPSMVWFGAREARRWLVRYFLVGLSLVVVVTFTVLYLAIGYPQGHGWGAESVGRIGARGKYCEMNTAGYIREHVNTWSNLAYVLTGLWVLVQGSWDLLKNPRREMELGETDYARKRDRDGERPMYGQRFYFTSYASTFVAIGLGSFLMHGSGTYWGSWVDNVGMISFVVFCTFYNIARMFRWSKYALAGIWISSCLLIASLYGGFRTTWDHAIFMSFCGILIATELMIVFPRVRRYYLLFPCVMDGILFGWSPLSMLWIVLAAMKVPTREDVWPRRKHMPTVWLCMFIFGLGWATWYISKADGPWCTETGVLRWIQGHAFWHFFTAAAGLTYYYYLRTEQMQRASKRTERRMWPPWRFFSSRGGSKKPAVTAEKDTVVEDGEKQPHRTGIPPPACDESPV